MEPPENFSFPFEPYDIQKSFMKELYKVLEHGKLGIFESPTGTGKSLSICCGAIQWLKDHEAKVKSNLLDEIEVLKSESNDTNNDENHWLYSDYNKIKKNIEIQNLQRQLEGINIRSDKLNKLRSRKILKNLNTNKIKKRWLNDKINDSKSKEFDIKNNAESNLDTEEDQIKSEELDFLIEDISKQSDESTEFEDTEDCSDTTGIKIFFCSRTHSQLSQFVNEIKRTSHNTDISVISLASRQQYCVNPSVKKLKSQQLINEQCLDLQKSKKGKTTKGAEGKIVKRSKTSTGCNYFNQTTIENLKDEAIIDIKDVEDLVDTAKELKACPYYSARAAIKDAQVIVVPYQTLLHDSTRRANGIDIKNNVVIIDEAHNLLETIGHIHSTEIYGKQLQVALDKLKHYKDKYNSRFAAKNLLLLNQFIYIVGRILGILKKSENDEKNSSNMYTLEEFVLKSNIDNYNLRPVIEFCIKSKLAQKLHGFCDRYPKEIIEEQKINDESKNKGLESFLNQMSKKKIEPAINPIINNPTDDSENKEKYISVGNVIQCVISFLETLTSTYNDGRILIVRNLTVDGSSLKFILLNPAAQFSNIINEARAVIVAGGTMQPFSEFRDQLFISAGAARERIAEFSCGHVIPPENILPICLTEGPSGKKLNFNYEMRKNPETLNEIGRILLNISNVIPGGIVCFFPSYDYEKTVYNHLSTNGIINKIENKKKVFREPKTTGQVDQILEEYSKVIKRCKNSGFNKSNLTGALMLSVVGGKLSEGLNFSDDLGRCVIVVGMPYPNTKSTELQEKMKYLNENVSPTAGNVHYENLCLKAVNQCIGRAVRHAADYATVLLLDERYSREHVCNALPKWIQGSLMKNVKFGTGVGAIAKFFASHKK